MKTTEEQMERAGAALLPYVGACSAAGGQRFGRAVEGGYGDEDMAALYGMIPG